MNLAVVRRSTWLVRSILLVAFVTSCSRPDDPILIGLAGPFSDDVGAPMKQAAALAVDEINASGGINGRKIQLIARDDYAEPDSAVQIATELDRRGVVAVIGHVYSGTTLAAAPVYNGASDPITQITPSSTAPSITQAGDYTFRICPSDLSYGAALARFARQRLGLARGAVLYLNDDYGRGIRRTFSEEFTRLGGEVTEADPYLGATPAVGPYFDRIAKQQAAQFVMVAGNRGEAEEALRQARSRGLKQPFMGGDGLEGIEASGPLAEGTYVSVGYMPAVDTERNRRFVALWRQKIRGSLPTQAAAATYDALYLLRDVIARVGTSRRAIRDGVAAIGTTQPAFEGVTGTIAFDKNGDVPNLRVIIGVARSGRLALAEVQ